MEMATISWKDASLPDPKVVEDQDGKDNKYPVAPLWGYI
jgi:hypothetical protein